MKIVIVNGSYRKNGATAQLLQEMNQQLSQYADVEVEMVHVADLKLNYCVGCSSCYQTGKCIYNDDIEHLSMKLSVAHGIILGSPTYASNVSAQMKVIIDRGHFVIEQLLHGKYAISVATYENYGGRDCAKILNRLLSYSGAKISATIISKSKFNSNPLEDTRVRKNIKKSVRRFYRDITKKHTHIFQNIKHFFVFQMGIKPFVIRKNSQYEGVIKHWRRRNIVNI